MMNYTLTGTAGNDTLKGVQRGGGTTDTIHGGDGNDKIYGYDGNDEVDDLKGAVSAFYFNLYQKGASRSTQQ